MKKRRKLGRRRNPRANTNQKRLTFLSHVLFCEECRVWTADGPVWGMYVLPPKDWNACEVGEKLRDKALEEDPTKD